MTHGLWSAVIPALWGIWLVYWIVSALGAKATAREEPLASRLSHVLPLMLGGALLGTPHILGAWGEQPFLPETLTWLWTGVTLTAAGLGFSMLARAWLGRNWSSMVTLKQDHELIRNGPYALVRHPIYTGLLLALLGTAITIGKWRALVGLVLLVAAVVRKLTIEERLMAEQFGDAYARYRSEVPALIPFVV